MYEQASLHKLRDGRDPHVWAGIEQAPEALDITIGTRGSSSASVVHEHRVRGEMTSKLPVVAPIPRIEHRFCLIACAFIVHDIPPVKPAGRAVLPEAPHWIRRVSPNSIGSN